MEKRFIVTIRWMAGSYRKALGFLLLLAASCSDPGVNLIPGKPRGPVYNYYCTWAIQNYLYGWGSSNFNLDSAISHNEAARRMNESWLTGKESWLSFYPDIRSDLIFLLDEGYNTTAKDGMEVDSIKFPSFGADPQERQARLVQRVKDSGWYGLGLWSRGIKSIPEAAERMRWSRNAGVAYWKVDGGDERCSYDSLRDKQYPGLVIEHASWPGVSVYNNGPGGTLMENYADRRIGLLENTDVVRIYDIDQPIGQVSGLSRVAGLLAVADRRPLADAVINCEDLVTLGAGLGCSFGIFRFPLTGKRMGGDPDIFNAGPRQTKQSMDAVTRAVHWHRIAPPYAANAMPFRADTLLLSDTFTVNKGESWDTKIPNPLVQAAPARVTRGLPLPTVQAAGAKPFVVASRHPDGPVSIATLGRHSNTFGYLIPLADIRLDLEAIPPAIGIFGRYRSLTIAFTSSIQGKRFLVQDLAGNRATDITDRVQLQDNTLLLPGTLIAEFGLSAARSGDKSDPGLLLVIR